MDSGSGVQQLPEKAMRPAFMQPGDWAEAIPAPCALLTGKVSCGTSRPQPLPARANMLKVHEAEQPQRLVRFERPGSLLPQTTV